MWIQQVIMFIIKYISSDVSNVKKVFDLTHSFVLDQMILLLLADNSIHFVCALNSLNFTLVPANLMAYHLMHTIIPVNIFTIK